MDRIGNPSTPALADANCLDHAAVLYIKRPYWIAEVLPRQALAIRPPSFALPKPIDTSSLKPEERSTLSCPMFERTRLNIGVLRKVRTYLARKIPGIHFSELRRTVYFLINHTHQKPPQNGRKRPNLRDLTTRNYTN